MAKKVVASVKLQIPAGRANPSPPVGPALSPYGVNIMEFCRAFNASTSNEEDTIIPVVITIFTDRTFSFITKTPPASVLLLKAVGVLKGSAIPNRDKIGKLTIVQIRDIAQKKINDLNTHNIDQAVRTIMGTARSMGIEIISKLS